MRDEKTSFRGVVVSIQPRIRLLRSFDQRSHTYLGYVLRVEGRASADGGGVSVAVSPGVQERYQLRVGDEISGDGTPVGDPRLEVAELYNVSGLRVVERGHQQGASGPPWLGPAAALAVYRKRGHRRLDAGTYEQLCAACVWGCRMPVEMIIDQWKPDLREHRLETFCYGPLSCPSYRPGPKRRVPGRKGMSWTEDDWVDQDEVSHRAPDE